MTIATTHRTTCIMRRTRAMCVRFTDLELTTIRDRAALCSTPIGRYIRETALGHSPAVPRRVGDAEVIRQLARIGNTLNQLARVAHTCGRLDDVETLQPTVETLAATLRKIA